MLSKDDLMSRVWPDKIVEENSLEAQIALLRRALGPDRELVRTIAGRGYEFTGAIRTGPIGEERAVATTPAATASLTSLCQSVSALFGRDAELREITERVTAHRLVTLVGPGGVAPAHASHVIRFQFDQLVMARMTLAQILWLQGFPDQAMRAADLNVEYAQSIGHALSLCNALGQAAYPIALLNGDLAAAQRYLQLLRETTERHGLNNWFGFNKAFEGMLIIRGGDLAKGLQALHIAFEQFPRMLGAALHRIFGRRGTGASVGGRRRYRGGHCDDRPSAAALGTSRAALVHLRAAPRQRRVTADAGCVRCADRSAGSLPASLEWARKQGALALELRCATSLSRLWHAQGATSQACELLAPVYERFTEGFATADLLAAKALLDDLR
ncbi:MAG: winged helix-turn-helix domain-containing protein [Betaproteobacteria bacterium]